MVVELVSEGRTNPEIGKVLGLTEGVVRHKRERLGLPSSIYYVKWTDEWDEIVREGAAAGETAEATGKKLGVSKHIIARRRQQLGYKFLGDRLVRAKEWLAAETFKSPEEELEELVARNQVFLAELLKESGGRYAVGELDMPPGDISKAVANTRRLTYNLHRM